MCVPTGKGTMFIALCTGNIFIALCTGNMFIALCKTIMFINITRNSHTIYILFVHLYLVACFAH